MENIKSPWNYRQNDTESVSTTILSKPNPEVIAAVLHSSSLTSSWWELAQVCCLLRGSTDWSSGWGSAPLLAVTLMLMLGLGTVGFVLPGAAGRILPSEWICLLLLLPQPPRWDCGAELSQATLFPFSYQAQVLVNNVEHNDLFWKILARLKSSCPHPGFLSIWVFRSNPKSCLVISPMAEASWSWGSHFPMPGVPLLLFLLGQLRAVRNSHFSNNAANKF